MARPDTEVVFDPQTYVDAMPFDALARLRRDSPVVWADEIPVLGWPAGPGFWLVLRHADVESVMKRPVLYSSWLGATQIRDPATPAALGYVRNMMLNMDPPEHSRLRQLLARSFTPRAVARLEERIRGHARALCDRAFAGRRGECDFAKDVAADLPLLTLADVLGMPEQDRWLLFDWSNRVIGYQDPDYASSADFDPSGGTPMAAEAVSLRQAPGPAAACPIPVPARACPISTHTPTCWRTPSGAAREMTSCRPSWRRSTTTAAGCRSRSSRTCSGCSRWPATRRCVTACRARASRCSSTRGRRMSCAPTPG